MPDQFWDSETETWDSDTDTWDALDAPPPPPPPPDGEGSGPGQARLLTRTLPEAPPTGNYRFLVGNLLTGDVSDELPIRTATYGFLRNRPGGMSIDVPRFDSRGQHYRQVNRSVIDPGASALYVERDGVLLWGGIIWTADPQPDVVRIGGEGFWSHFRKTRHPGIPDPGRPDHNKLKRYNDQDQFDIVRDLIAFVQAEPDLDLGVIVDDLMSGAVRDEVFRPEDRRNIGEAIETLAEQTTNGFDFSLDVNWEGDAIAKRLHLFSSRGRRTDIVLDDHKNCAVRSRSIEAKDVVREVTATGAGTGKALRRYTVTDETLAGQRPLYQDVVSYSDVKTGSETKDIATLSSRATKQVSRRKAPMETISLTVQPQADLPIGAWRTGDYVRVRADDEFDPVDGFYRIVGWDVRVNESGQEEVGMDFGPIPA